MTIPEFIERLKATPRQWCKHGDALRINRPSATCDCPISAVVRMDVPGANATVCYAEPVTVGADVLGMVREDVQDIIDAADGYTEDFQGVNKLVELRKQLVEACGL